MSADRLPSFSPLERSLYARIASADGIMAKDLAAEFHLSRTEINRLLFSSPLMHELCYQDRTYRWHAMIRQDTIHEGLYEFSGWYGTVQEFLSTEEDNWLSQLEKGCRRVGRNLNDTRGLYHSFMDCRHVMRNLFQDLNDMAPDSFQDWEIVFELRINRSRMIRIYADVLVITPRFVFVLEFKMKNLVDPEEVMQAAKYAPYLEVIFGTGMEIVPALVLTKSSELFEYVQIGRSDMILPVASGDMLFNVFNEYLGFLR